MSTDGSGNNTLNANTIKDGSATKTLAEYSSSAWSWGSGVPAGTILQTKDYTFTNSRTFNGITGVTWRWVTDTLKGGSSDHITFDNHITANNKVYLCFLTTVCIDNYDCKFVNFFIREGSSTNDGINAGTNVAGQNTSNGDGQGIYCYSDYYTSGSQHGNTHDVSFQHAWTESNTNPNYNIVFTATSGNSSTEMTVHIGRSGFSNYTRSDVHGYTIRLQEIQA